MLLKEKLVKRKEGITLVALVVTIVVLLILAGISIMYTLGDKSIINKAKEAKNKTEGAVKNEQKDFEELKNLLNDELQDEPKKNICSYQINIGSSIETYYPNLGALTVVYTIRGTYDGTTVFEDIVADVLEEAGTKRILVNADLPVDTVLRVSQVYSGASYELISSGTQEIIATEETNALNFEFTGRYNNDNKANGIVDKIDDLVIAELNNDYKVETCPSGGVIDIQRIKQNQEETAVGVNVTIKNISKAENWFVRVKMFCLNDSAYSVKLEGESTDLWKLGEEGYWYYNPYLATSITTKPLTIQKMKTIKLL